MQQNNKTEVSVSFFREKNGRLAVSIWDKLSKEKIVKLSVPAEIIEPSQYGGSLTFHVDASIGKLSRVGKLIEENFISFPLPEIEHMRSGGTTNGEMIEVANDIANRLRPKGWTVEPINHESFITKSTEGTFHATVPISKWSPLKIETVETTKA